MFWLYLVTDRAGSWAVLRARAEEEAPRFEAAADVELLDCYENAAEAVEALVQVESRLAKAGARTRPSRERGPEPRNPRGH
jgi:hypothetical protein